MQCFTFYDLAVPRLYGVVDDDGDPVIPQPEGCAVPVVLGGSTTQHLGAFLAKAPHCGRFTLGYNNSKTVYLPERARRVGVELELAMNTLVLKMPPLRPARRSKEQALVRVQTMGGVRGKVRLTSNVYDESLDKGRVVYTHHPFPPVGVNPLCTDEMLKKVNAGVEELDLFILMNQGARFRIHRTGGLEGAERYTSVCWTGETLRPMHPDYDDRGTGDTFATA